MEKYRINHKNKSDIIEAENAYKNAKNKISTIYGPGKWRSDLFIIDDLKEFIKRIRNN